MNYDNDYSANMDYVREKFNLPETTSLYECVGRLVDAYKELTETKVESLKEKKDDRTKGSNLGSKPRRKPGRPAKRNKS